MLIFIFTLEGYAWLQSGYELTDTTLSQLGDFNTDSNLILTHNELLYYCNYEGDDQEEHSTTTELEEYSTTELEALNLLYLAQEVEIEEENSQPLFNPSFNPYQVYDPDVSLFPQSPTAISCCISSTDMSIISISSDTSIISVSSDTSIISISSDTSIIPISSDLSSSSSFYYSDNIIDNGHSSEGEDDVFSTITNACMRCGRDMGEMNPRQLCGKDRCLIYNRK